jgi:LuxR family quorum-sensing transcriptional regulator LasR
MKSIEQIAELTTCTCETSWRNKIFQFGRELGYEHTLLAILPSRDTQPEASNAFLQSNFPPKWRTKYDDEQMSYIDPTVAHCMTKSIPLIRTPQVFATRSQKELYEESCNHGLCSGINLPVRGSNGEFGMLYFASAIKPDRRFEAEAIRNIPVLTCLRDFVCETSQRFMKQSVPTTRLVDLTKRELECLKLCADGKSSWDIGQILNCTEAGVNFHFSNIRLKFGTTSRHQALVKAIQMGLINPP